VNRGRNGWDFTPAVGVCFDASKAGHTQVSLDYIGAHDGTSTTLLVSESPLTPAGVSTAYSTSNTPGVTHLFIQGAKSRQPSVPDGDQYWFRPQSQWLAPVGTTSALVAGLGLWKQGDSTADESNPTGYTGKCSFTDLEAAECTLGFEWGSLAATTRPTTMSVADQIGSRHSGSVIGVGFCDGHQLWLSNSINVNTFRHLMTPYDKGCVTAGLTDAPTDVLNEGDYN
jgi:prepilin-type processing-associated H-X9-DG protein